MKPLKDEEVIFTKNLSAFSHPWLKNKLQDLEITEIVITGVYTNLAVFFTAVDAKKNGFKVIIDENCILTDNNVTQAVFINELKETHEIEIF